jgi:hypothetical protein
MPMEANTESKATVNLVSRSRTRNRKRRPASSRSDAKVRRHLADPGTVGVGGDAEQVRSAAFDLDHEEHGQDALGLDSKELVPRGA